MNLLSTAEMAAPTIGWASLTPVLIVLGGADVEQAREMGEVIRHGNLLNGEGPAERPGAVSG